MRTANDSENVVADAEMSLGTCWGYQASKLCPELVVQANTGFSSKSCSACKIFNFS
jgi:hypothetical protein